MPPNTQVLIIQEVMKHYRVPFYEKLHTLLSNESIQLRVAYSPPYGSHLQKADNSDLPPSFGGLIIPITPLFHSKLVYQHALSLILESDLIIVEQANKHLINYILMLLSLFKIKRFAFWGHGRNFQVCNLNLKERVKQKLITTPDWWFAYTTETADYVSHHQFPASRITTVENSIDISEFQKNLANIDQLSINAFRAKLNIPNQGQIGLYCGAMYSEKELPFLLQSLLLIRQKTPDFSFIFTGAGPDQHLIEEFCQQHTWAHYVGPVFGEQKALCFACADMVLNPGLVGLGVLDAFAAGIPMITTEYPKHSPEIAYLENRHNGIITPFDINAYANDICELLSQPGLIQQLGDNAKESAKHYSIENMAKNFADGIIKALAG